MSEPLHLARAAVEVTAGLIPSQPMPEYTRRWAVTSEEWQGLEDASLGTSRVALLAERNGQALGYAALLMASPHLVNWVRVDWIWY